MRSRWRITPPRAPRSSMIGGRMTHRWMSTRKWVFENAQRSESGEALEMTFQVVMVGSDGIIAGSDRKIGIRDTRTDELFNDAGPWQFSISTKFVFADAERKVI